MRYLIVQDWDNTHGNHAGMVHMCKLLCEKYPGKYNMFVKEMPVLRKKKGKGIISRVCQFFYRFKDRKRFAAEYITLCSPMFERLKNEDEVFLLEYHLQHVSQFELAKYIKKHYPFVRIYGLTHLTPLWFETHKGSGKMIRKWSRLLDKQLTLGSTLSHYLEVNGIPKEKISTGYHYVDIDYYNGSIKEVDEPLTVISIGALQRDFQLLADIVNGCGSVNWIICKGRKKIDDLFEGHNNVKLVGYVEEDELRALMSNADLSLNVLEDTVGSNVITTSMAMGLGMIVSDVGAIRDYCNEECAVFCDNTAESFIKGINDLIKDRLKVEKMKRSAMKRASAFDIKGVAKWFDSLNK